MMTLTVKMKKQRIFAVFFTLVVAFALTAAVKLGKAKDHTVMAQYILSVDSNDERVKFLSSYGWQTAGEPCEISDVIIPAEFNDVYEQYNEIQLKQGCDLGEFKSYVVKKYTYEITNYPLSDEALKGTVFAHLLVYQNEIIGGDISSTSLNGFMHGFEKPQ